MRQDYTQQFRLPPGQTFNRRYQIACRFRRIERQAQIQHDGRTILFDFYAGPANLLSTAVNTNVQNRLPGRNAYVLT